MVFGQAAFFGPAVHGDGLEGGDGAGDAAQRGLHVGRVILPDGLLGAEGDEGARLWRVLFGHVPALDGGAGGGACRPAPSGGGLRPDEQGGLLEESAAGCHAGLLGPVRIDKQRLWEYGRVIFA